MIEPVQTNFPTFELDNIFRMPVTLGPAPGPRNMPKSKAHLRFDGDVTAMSVRALTDAEALTALLPPRCRLAGAPVFSTTITMFKNLGWLAGRGYNLVRVGCEVIYNSSEGEVRGNLALVLWENHADPILTGREELGMTKLYATIPDLRLTRDTGTGTADWEGFKFLEMSVTDLKATPDAPIPPQYTKGGIPNLCHRYHLKVGEYETADIDVMTIATPGQEPAPEVLEQYSGNGTFKFHVATWEDMPTQYPYPTTLASLPILEFRGANLFRVKGIADLAAMRTLP